MKAHLKRLMAPNTWPIKIKGITFITRPAGAGSPMHMSIPLVIAMKDMLAVAKTTKEVKHILHTHEVTVDGARVYNHDASVAFLGTLSFLKHNYRLIITNKNTLAFVPITDTEANLRPCRIEGKTLLGKGKVQINCSSGINLTVSKDLYKTADTILIDLKKKSVAQHIPFEKGALVFLYKGAHVGHLATVKDVHGKSIFLKADDGREFETRRAYCFTVGKTKPLFTLA